MLCMAALEERSNPPHNLAGPLAIANDPFRSFVGFANVGGGGRKPAYACIAVGNYGAQWLVDFVRDRRRQFSNSGNLRCPREAGLRQTECLLDILSVINI